MEYYNKVILQNNTYYVKTLYEYHKIIILLFNFKGTYLSILIVEILKRISSIIRYKYYNI